MVLLWGCNQVKRLDYLNGFFHYIPFAVTQAQQIHPLFSQSSSGPSASCGLTLSSHQEVQVFVMGGTLVEPLGLAMARRSTFSQLSLYRGNARMCKWGLLIRHMPCPPKSQLQESGFSEHLGLVPGAWCLVFLNYGANPCTICAWGVPKPGGLVRVLSNPLHRCQHEGSFQPARRNLFCGSSFRSDYGPVSSYVNLQPDDAPTFSSHHAVQSLAGGNLGQDSWTRPGEAIQTLPAQFSDRNVCVCIDKDFIGKAKQIGNTLWW